MIAYFLRRLAGAIPTLFIIITLTFFLMRVAPGGPFDREQSLAPEIMAHLNRAYGFDQPMIRQYANYLAALARGDFGPSFKYKDFSVTELIGQGLPITLELGVLALGLALAVGVPAGIGAALYHNTVVDYVGMSLTVLGLAVPSFVILPFLGLAFGVRLHWLPVSGWEGGEVRDMVLPVVTLALVPFAYVARLTRSGMLDVLQSGFMRQALAKGLPLRTVILRHALKPAIAPVFGYLAPASASVMTGSLVVENIAGIPGVGRYLVQGALNRDYTLVLGMVIVYSTILIATGLIVDLLYAWVDPRVRLAR